MSNDNTISICEKIFNENRNKINIIKEKDDGISDAFSKGVLASDSEVIGILSSDDEYYDEMVLKL